MPGDQERHEAAGRMADQRHRPAAEVSKDRFCIGGSDGFGRDRLAWLG